PPRARVSSSRWAPSRADRRTRSGRARRSWRPWGGRFPCGRSRERLLEAIGCLHHVARRVRERAQARDARGLPDLAPHRAHDGFGRRLALLAEAEQTVRGVEPEDEGGDE